MSGRDTPAREYVQALENLGKALVATTAAFRLFASALETGPRTGIVRIGPGIEGLRRATL